MPLYLHFVPSFKRSLKNLDHEKYAIINLLLEALDIYYETNCNLLEAQKIAPRFFYKQLRKPFYEAGVEGKLRIVIRREESDCFALLIGNHDQIKKFLTGQ